MKFIAIIVLITVNFTELKAQENYETGKILIIVNDDKIIPEKGSKSSNVEFENILQEFNINSIRQVMPFARTLELTRLYELNTSKNIDSMIVRLQQLNVSQNLFYSIEKCFKPQPLYDPSDYMWWLTLNSNPNNDSWLWYLKKIEADKAWNITKGDPNIKVAVIDDGIDPLHPDLVGKINPPYNFHTGTPFSPQSHGTSVGTILAAETVNQGQTPNGQMASIGYNTKIMFNSWNNGVEACVYASTVMKAKVISISWVFGCSPTTSMLLAEQEILNNGTTIIRAAGNGNQHCGGQRLYPFSGYEDDRTIVVTSVGSDDKHYNGANTNSHYPSVDVSAPGYSLMGGTSTDGGTNSWPYYGSWGGTSQSTPIVSGLAALILSVNNCLESQDIQIIIKSTTDPIVDASNYPGMVGTGRINAYKAVLMASTYGEVAPITSNTTWSGDKFINDELIIEQGATLTITGTVRFSANSRVIVKQGGKLILDGGKLTNSNGCDDFWQGIQVYGTTNKNQFPESNPTYQGLLIIKNGGIIENAHLAVSNWKVDDYNSIGGVVQTNNAVFRNNRRDVAFMSYQNYNTNYTNKYRNLSKFTNTDFVTTNDFIEKGLAIQTHVTMWQVDGITFTNCHFSNDITTNKNNSSAPNRGIYSIDAGYSVLAGCSTTPPLGQQCPTANLLKSSFKGFSSAIEAAGAATTQTVTIQQANFIDNVWGITIDDFDNVSLNRNTMDVGDADYTLFWPIGAGIMVNNSTGYKIEENTVSTNLTGGFRVGINVSNSGTDDNRVYKNNLQALNNGVAGNGVNHNSNYQKGLQFLCNNFQNNTTAIAINSSPTNDGVRFYQGDFSPLKSAGNIFTNNTTDINNTANSIVYIHNGGNTQPVNNSGMVSLQSTTNTNSCPTSFGGGIIMKPILLVLDSLNTELGGQTASYNNLNFTYTSLIDNGNTEQFKDNIELNWSDDAWKLRGKLLASSPYLSSEVLLKAAKQNVLPNGMLLEILLANPDATKGEKFISQLKTVTNNTFPEYMLDYVRGNFDSRTLRTDMEGQLSSIHSELSNTRSWIKHLTKSKEEYTDNDRLNVVNLGDDIYSKVGVMDYYITQGAFNKADSVLNTINNDKKYTTDLPLIENFSDYINFRENLGNRNLAQLDSTEVAYLQILANGKGRVAGYAQNILCFFYAICYEKELATGNAQNKAMLIPSANSQEALNNVLYTVTLYPNPAKEYTSIQWEIYDELNNLHYNVVDINGREQLSGILSDNKGEQVIDTRKLKQGLYIIGIYNNNQLKVSKKLVVENQK